MNISLERSAFSHCNVHGGVSCFPEHHIPAWEVDWTNNRGGSSDDGDSSNDISSSLSYSPYTHFFPRYENFCLFLSYAHTYYPRYEDFWLDIFSVPTVETSDYTW